jgi:hypothetical protein
MNACQKTRNRLAASLEGDVGGADEDAMKKHLDECPECRRTADEVRRILDGAESVRGDLGEVMATIDWEALPRRIADAAFAGPRPNPESSPSRSFWRALIQPRWRPVYAGLLAGIVFGAVGMLFLLHPRGFRSAEGVRYFVSGDLIDRAELQLAKRETLDFLDKSQSLIQDFVQTEPGQTGRLQSERASQRMQDMLSKKRYINPQLDKFQMAKAREICNQIEILFLELSQISDELTAEEAAKIKGFIGQKRLLLKIQLLKNELQKSEV